MNGSQLIFGFALICIAYLVSRSLAPVSQSNTVPRMPRCRGRCAMKTLRAQRKAVLASKA
ncbi:hypothetical protein PSPO01_09084 [Paraphaeosphaeria sporulosa]